MHSIDTIVEVNKPKKIKKTTLTKVVMELYSDGFWKVTRQRRKADVGECEDEAAPNGPVVFSFPGF